MSGCNLSRAQEKLRSWDWDWGLGNDQRSNHKHLEEAESASYVGANCANSTAMWVMMSLDFRTLSALDDLDGSRGFSWQLINICKPLLNVPRLCFD